MRRKVREREVSQCFEREVTILREILILSDDDGKISQAFNQRFKFLSKLFHPLRARDFTHERRFKSRYLSNVYTYGESLPNEAKLRSLARTSARNSIGASTNKGPQRRIFSSSRLNEKTRDNGIPRDFA
mgnify:CR=1 FL=1